ncbi:MAG TPA: SGNH/GDSL hydrolase family protein [Pyrinomonadaceae bacterium]
MNKHVAAILIPPLLPVLLTQGYWLRKTTPRLPDAAGPLEGAVGGEGTPLKLITVGESTVAGVGARTHETALTGQLAFALSRETKRPVAWSVVARSGINARNCRLELAPKLKGISADVVMIALGVNDTIELHSARRWANDVEKLIEAVRDQSGDVLVLLSGVPPLNAFPALPQPLSSVLGARSAALEKATVQLAKRLPRVVHVPFAIGKDCEELFCADGFHPSERGYALWAEQLAAAFAKTQKD